MALLLDSGAVSFLASRNQRAGALLGALQHEGLWPPVVLSPVLVECLQGDSGRDANANRLLKSCDIVTGIDEDRRAPSRVAEGSGQVRFSNRRTRRRLRRASRFGAHRRLGRHHSIGHQRQGCPSGADLTTRSQIRSNALPDTGRAPGRQGSSDRWLADRGAEHALSSFGRATPVRPRPGWYFGIDGADGLAGLVAQRPERRHLGDQHPCGGHTRQRRAGQRPRAGAVTAATKSVECLRLVGLVDSPAGNMSAPPILLGNECRLAPYSVATTRWALPVERGISSGSATATSTDTPMLPLM